MTTPTQTREIQFNSLMAFARRAVAAGLAPASYWTTGMEFQVLEQTTLRGLAQALSTATFGGSFAGGGESARHFAELSAHRREVIAAKQQPLADLWGDSETWPQVLSLLMQYQPACV